MKKYTVYFEVFGKKMKTVVSADSPSDAKLMIRKRLKEIVFYDVVMVEEERVGNTNAATDLLNIIFGKGKW